MWKADFETAAYDPSAVKNPEAPWKMANAVATVRSERGYSATNYDASPAKLQKTLRGQSGQKYDAKKIRNSSNESAIRR